MARSQGASRQLALHALPPTHASPLPRVQGLLQTIWLLLTSIVCVPAATRLIPGGSPVLGYLVSWALAALLGPTCPPP